MKKVNMKKIILFMLVMSLMVFAVACGNDSQDNSEPTDTETTEPVDGTADTVEDDDTSDEGNVEAGDFTAEQPILLTSVGQSADVEMVKSMLEKLGYDYNSNNLATPDDIGDAKTLILAIGGSSKGLGAAGIDADAELERVNELIDSAKSEGLSIISVHIGGEARRGELSDKFIKPAFDQSDYAIVVESGDTDGFMQGLANDNGIGINLIDQITETTTALEAIFE